VHGRVFGERQDGILQVYRRLARFEKSDGTIEVQFAFDVPQVGRR